MASELKPCAHCNGAAELDYEQPFCAFPSGKLEKQVAIYCNACDVHMSMCYSDFPEYDHDQMAAILTEKWNTRPAPAATDTGLETVAKAYLTPSGIKCEWNSKYRFVNQTSADLVHRPQAEELLAAEIELKQYWKDEAERFRIEFEKVAYDWRLSKVRVEALEAELAAAQKALEAIEDHAARCFALSTHSTTALAYLKDIQDEARAVLGRKP